MDSKLFLDYEGLQKFTNLLNAKLAEIGSRPNGVPAGIISAWSGSVDALPDGWVLCDGQNGTPDLRDRFILGAGSSHTVGETGGSETHRISTKEMPEHYHDYEISTPYIDNRNLTGGSLFSGGEPVIGEGGTAGVTGTSGSGEPFDIMPPYYVLAYIMKVAAGGADSTETFIRGVVANAIETGNYVTRTQMEDAINQSITAAIQASY